MLEMERDIDKSIRFHQLLCKFSERFLSFQSNVSSSKAVKDNTDSNDDSLRPIERYWQVSAEDRRTKFFQDIKQKCVVLGVVTNILGNLVCVDIIRVCSGEQRWIADLQIKANCKLSDEELKKKHSGFDAEIEVGDKVKGVVMTINYNLQELHLSFEDRNLSAADTHHFPLGKLDDDDLLMDFHDVDHEDDIHSNEKVNYLHDLCMSKSFLNPSCVSNLTDFLSIDVGNATFLKRKRVEVPHGESADALRDQQSYKWSMDVVATGVKHFKSGELAEASKCFDQAITFYPRNVEALVARGALKANQNNLREAVCDFRDALAINPKHRNGNKYCCETLVTIAKSHEKQSKWKEASKCYKEVLQLDPKHSVAKERFAMAQQLVEKKDQDLQSDEVVTSKNLADSSKEKIRKLKQILESQVSNEEMKHSRRKRHSSTSSSSSTKSSASTDTASEQDDWIEKGDQSLKFHNQGSERIPIEGKVVNNVDAKGNSGQRSDTHGKRSFDEKFKHDDNDVSPEPDLTKKKKIENAPSLHSHHAKSSSRHQNSTRENLKKAEIRSQDVPKIESDHKDRKNVRDKEHTDTKEPDKTRDRSRSRSSKSGSESNQRQSRKRSEDKSIVSGSNHSSRSKSTSDSHRRKSSDNKERKRSASTDKSDHSARHKISARVKSESSYARERSKSTEKYRSSNAREKTNNFRQMDNSEKKISSSYNRSQSYPEKTYIQRHASSDDFYERRETFERRSIERKGVYEKNNVRNRDYQNNQMGHFDARQRLEGRGESTDFMKSRNYVENRSTYNNARTNFFPRRIVRHARQ